ncbi:MAG: hypothetical protein M1834_001873 [Cirrosporium novae-zelandiae]|nr:MAG: hypothetical protein M1834_001873 [Cirrosporium novae-zelandiae]
MAPPLQSQNHPDAKGVDQEILNAREWQMADDPTLGENQINGPSFALQRPVGEASNPSTGNQRQNARGRRRPFADYHWSSSGPGRFLRPSNHRLSLAPNNQAHSGETTSLVPVSSSTYKAPNIPNHEYALPVQYCELDKSCYRGFDPRNTASLATNVQPYAPLVFIEKQTSVKFQIPTLDAKTLYFFSHDENDVMHATRMIGSWVKRSLASAQRGPPSTQQSTAHKGTLQRPRTSLQMRKQALENQQLVLFEEAKGIESRNFAKVYAHTIERDERDRKDIQKKEVLLTRRREPPPTQGFRWTVSLLINTFEKFHLQKQGHFLWPVDEVPISVLGLKLEVLDTLRKKQNCSITFDSERLTIKVCADSQEIVEFIFGGIRVIFLEIIAQDRQPQKLIVVNPPATDKMRKIIEMVDEGTQRNDEGDFDLVITRSMRLIGDKLSKTEQQEWNIERETIAERDRDRIELRIKSALASLQVHRGYIRMRVDFGRFVFTDYKAPKNEIPQDGKSHRFTIHEVMEWVGDSRTRGYLMPSFDNNATGMNPLELCYSRPHLFVPADSTLESLRDVQPVYSAAIDLPQRGQNNVRLISEVTISDTNVVTPSSQRCVRLGPGQSALEIHVVDFERAAWRLQITAQRTVGATKVPPQFKLALESLKFDGKVARSQTGQIYVNVSNAIYLRNIVRLQQMATWKFKTRGLDFELTRCETFEKKDLPNFTDQSPLTTWSAVLYDQEWDQKFAVSNVLKAGQRASWIPTPREFFSTSAIKTGNESSFQAFYNKVGEIAALLQTK